MNDIVKPDRGTVKRITFDLLYPNGQIKTVVVENNSAENYGTFSAIILDEHGLNNFLLKNAAATKVNDKSIEELWNNIAKGDNPQWKPAMLIVNTDGDVIAKCGAHKQLTPPHQTIK